MATNETECREKYTSIIATLIDKRSTLASIQCAWNDLMKWVRNSSQYEGIVRSVTNEILSVAKPYMIPAYAHNGTVECEIRKVATDCVYEIYMSYNSMPVDKDILLILLHSIGDFTPISFRMLANISLDHNETLLEMAKTYDFHAMCHKAVRHALDNKSSSARELLADSAVFLWKTICKWGEIHENNDCVVSARKYFATLVELFLDDSLAGNLEDHKGCVETTLNVMMHFYEMGKINKLDDFGNLAIWNKKSFWKRASVICSSTKVYFDIFIALSKFISILPNDYRRQDLYKEWIDAEESTYKSIFSYGILSVTKDIRHRIGMIELLATKVMKGFLDDSVKNILILMARDAMEKGVKSAKEVLLNLDEDKPVAEEEVQMTCESPAVAADTSMQTQSRRRAREENEEENCSVHKCARTH